MAAALAVGGTAQNAGFAPTADADAGRPLPQPIAEWAVWRSGTGRLASQYGPKQNAIRPPRQSAPGNGLQPERHAQAMATAQGRAAGQPIAGPRGRFWVKKRQKRTRQHTPYEKKGYLYTT